MNPGMEAIPNPATIDQPGPVRWFAWLGLVLIFFGPILFFIQLRDKQLVVPWYVPILGTVGLGLLIVSLTRARTAWGIAGVVFIGLVVVGEWYFLLALMRLPAYSGPVAVGSPLPTFTATRANGSPFTQDDLKGTQNTMLVFFRGRW